MTINTENLLNSILASLDRVEHIKPSELPDIDLYMDQVTTFMDERLRPSTRNPREDKILTKTMINNYAKNDLLPSPNKKRYSKEHMLMLIFIYYFKGVLSINDIQSILGPLTDRYFGKNGEINLQSIYEEVFGMEREEVAHMKEDLIRKFQVSQNTFADVEGDEQKFLQWFSFICELSFDVYMKKLLIEKMVDGLRAMDPSEPDLSAASKKKKRKDDAEA